MVGVGLVIIICWDWMYFYFSGYVVLPSCRRWIYYFYSELLLSESPLLDLLHAERSVCVEDEHVLSMIHHAAAS